MPSLENWEWYIKLYIRDTYMYIHGLSCWYARCTCTCTTTSASLLSSPSLPPCSPSLPLSLLLAPLPPPSLLPSLPPPSLPPFSRHRAINLFLQTYCRHWLKSTESHTHTVLSDELLDHQDYLATFRRSSLPPNYQDPLTQLFTMMKRQATSGEG